MSPFTYQQPHDTATALELGSKAGSAFIAGGTTLIDLWKLGAFPVRQLVDINELALGRMVANPGSLSVGALERMSTVASHPDVVKNYPVLAQALLLSASPQIRNMASMGGNLLQRPRSVTYRSKDASFVDGPSRFDAIFGVTPKSAAPYPSDLAVALMAMDATLQISSISGQRDLKLSEFYQIPYASTNLWKIAPGELITSIQASVPFARRSAYVKIRDRASFQFAIVSAAVLLDLDGENIREARIAAGGVGTIPWRLPEVESRLRGQPANLSSFQSALANLGEGSVVHSKNQFKIELLKRTILRAMTQANQLS